VNGILIIDKPAGITSHDVVARARRILKTKRVGHTGTLDPFATGVMVMLIGNATRLAQFLDKDEKEYEALIAFGFETDTGDVTGKRRVTEIEDGTVTGSDVERILSRFRGEILQTPPMYSAKKVDGKKLYELARQGVEVERKEVAVTIGALEFKNSNDGNDPIGEAAIRVVCSAGTYIRTLAEDIGRAVGVGAHLTELRRTRAGQFTIAQAITLEELDSLEQKTNALLSVNVAVAHLPVFSLAADRVGKTKNGMSTRTFTTELTDQEVVQMLDPAGGLVAIGYFDQAEKAVQPKVVLS